MAGADRAENASTRRERASIMATAMIHAATTHARPRRIHAPSAGRATLKTTPPPEPPPWTSLIQQLKPGTYADGLPLDEVQYLCCKLVLRPNHFVTRRSLFDFAKVLKEPAGKHDATFSHGTSKKEPIQIREVLFVDTADFRLYKNAFILRRRIRYEDGFPAEEPEIVFKFRHRDLQVAAETDVRPQILGDHRIKFKCQALPLKQQLGGVRLLYSHNVQFPRSNVGGGVNELSMATMTRIFPALERIKTDPNERITLVSNTIIEEVQQEIGSLDFGDGMEAPVDVALWRTRGEHRPLIGELSFQIKFSDWKDLNLDAMKRAKAFFIDLQYAARHWIALDATKTGVVYRLNGNAPMSHE
jgi:hypothetical protein